MLTRGKALFSRQRTRHHRRESTRRVRAANIAIAETDDSGGSKAQFKYQDMPGNKGERCDGCSLWKAPDSCTIVKGKISPKGYCVAYSPKSH